MGILGLLLISKVALLCAAFGSLGIGLGYFERYVEPLAEWVVNSELVGISLALIRVITIATQGGNHSLSRCFENQ